MTNETSDSIPKSNEKKISRRPNKTKPKTIVSSPTSSSEKLASRQTIIQRLTSYFTYESSDKTNIKLNNNKKKEHKTNPTKRSFICQHLCCELFLFFCTIYIIMYLRPDYSIYIRNTFENILKKFNLTSEEFQFRPGQRLAQYRQPSMPIIIIPGIISTGLELWKGTECTAGKFRHRFWTSIQMVDSIGRDHQCWLKHISLNLSTWYVENNTKDFYCLFYRKDPESIRLRPVLGWAAADYVYVIKIFILINLIFVFGIVRFPGYWLWSKVIHNLADIGYDPTNLVTLGYDWRLPPQILEERDGYFTQLKFYTEFLR
jgi:hypothetical protein